MFDKAKQLIVTEIRKIRSKIDQKKREIFKLEKTLSELEESIKE